MWHYLRKFNRTELRKVSKEEAEWLQSKLGGETINTYPADEKVIGIISSDKAIYSYGMLEIEADGKHICTVTRKKDAFRIMQALKRDYKDIIVRLK